MSYKNSKVEISDLVLVDFRSRHLTPAIRQWKDEHAVPYAESCARQIWYGTEEDFADFPEDSNVECLQGADAYSLLLSLIAGFESKRTGETHIRHQFYSGWNVFKEEHPDIARNFGSVIKQLKTDTKYIQDYITHDWKTRREEHAALDLAGQKKGDKILLIGGITRHGNASTLTAELAKVCESRQRPDRDFLTITHPDPEALEVIKHDIGLLQSQKIIRLNINYASFEDLAKAVETNDHVYSAMAMDSQPEAEEELIRVWQGRSRDDNTLSCVRGSPQHRGGSPETWKNAELDNYCSPEDIRAELMQRYETNKAIEMRARNAFDIFGRHREQGLSPRHNMTEQQARELKLELKVA